MGILSRLTKRQTFVLNSPLVLPWDGEIAQSVEQRTENPCVPSSILGFATTHGKQ